MWSLHISELTWRDLFSLYIPRVCKGEKKLSFDDFLLFRLLLWWVEIKKKKKSLKFEGKVCRLFSDKQMLAKWEGTGRTVEATGMRHQSQQISLPNWESDARATQASLHTRAPGHALFHWSASHWKRGLGMRNTEAAFLYNL